jgi:uncharacterized membrane protein YeaQ/YmgE (transglycosylase-associated protein family)
MYWALTGYSGGFLAAFVMHSYAVGHFTSELLWVLALFAFLLLLVAVDAEALFLARWGRKITRRRAAGILTWKFCSMVGTVVGAVVYPVVALLRHHFLDEQSRDREVVGIALIVGLVGSALLLVWYLLMRFPKSDDAT